MRNKRAFTLIELLIVVAIIAILAAIAVPNFLEAQTRAKVSRVQADLRALSPALEAYNVDSNSYPPDGDDLNPFNPFVDFDVALRMRVLTTPISYMSRLPEDPFHQDKVDFPAAIFLFPGDPPYTFSYNTFGSHFGGNFQPANTGDPDNYGLTSLGPSKQFDSGQAGPLLYDPTNGTTSLGDIIRLGGNRTPLSP